MVPSFPDSTFPATFPKTWPTLALSQMWTLVHLNLITNPMQRHLANTHMRAERFEVQTAQRYVENLIIDFATDALHIDNTHASKAAIFAADVLRGARFVFEISEGCKGDINVVSFESKSKAISEPYHQEYTEWLTRHVFSKLTPGTHVLGCTEHKRHNQFLFRAHPSYRGHNQWHDWATFDCGPVAILSRTMIVFVFQVKLCSSLNSRSNCVLP
jgi:hypothetical protein